jgi:hypothetical protein
MRSVNVLAKSFPTQADFLASFFVCGTTSHSSPAFFFTAASSVQVAIALGFLSFSAGWVQELCAAVAKRFAARHIHTIFPFDKKYAA